MDFENLKNSQSNFDKLTKQIEANLNPEDNAKTKNKYQDDRLWKPELDKTGNGYAVLRFLPAPQKEEMPWARVWSHAFQGPGGWYIENSLTTLGQKDPVSEYNTSLWNNGTDAGKETARKQKRKLTYVANIYVVKDPANPSNEGQVMLYKFGKKIFDKITAAMQPEFEDEEAIDPFDFWQGANFKLKAKNVAGYRNYDSSEFARQDALLEDDEAMEAIWKKEYSLEDFVAPDQFKSYDELKKRLDYVLGLKGTTKFQDQETVEQEEEFRQQNRAESPSVDSTTTSSSPFLGKSSSNDEDDDIDEFVFFYGWIEITNRWTESIEVSFSNRVVGSSVLKLPDWCPRSCLNIEPKHLETKAR